MLVVPMQGRKFSSLYLDVYELIAGTLDRLAIVEFELDGEGVLVLGALDKKDHQESDDGRPGVDDELPRV